MKTYRELYACIWILTWHLYIALNLFYSLSSACLMWVISKNYLIVILIIIKSWYTHAHTHTYIYIFKKLNVWPFSIFSQKRDGLCLHGRHRVSIIISKTTKDNCREVIVCCPFSKTILFKLTMTIFLLFIRLLVFSSVWTPHPWRISPRPLSVSQPGPLGDENIGVIKVTP